LKYEKLICKLGEQQASEFVADEIIKIAFKNSF
jgi:hypothetical protein